MSRMPARMPLSRSSSDRMIAGVCAGIARSTGTSTFVVRLVTLAACLLFGSAFVAYLILWAVLPLDDAPPVRRFTVRR